MEVNDWIYNRILKKKNNRVLSEMLHFFVYNISNRSFILFKRKFFYWLKIFSDDEKYVYRFNSNFNFAFKQIFQPDQNKLCLIFGMSLLLIFFFFWSVLLRIFCTCIWPYLCRHLSEATTIAFLTHLITFNHNQKNK